LETIFLDIGIIIIVAGLLAYLARLLRQPLIPAFIIVGIILGPVLGIITDKSVVDALSEIGITFLLFSAGLELNLKKLKEVGKVVTVGALAQMAILFGAGYFAFKLMGYATIPSIYIGVIIIFSSTLVIVKLLADKKELDTLHGRIIIGMLLMQDLVAIIVLSMLNSFGAGMLGSIALMFAKGLLILGIGFFLAKLVFASIFKFAARNDELLFIVSLMMMFFFAAVYMSIGFSIAIGAFIAGILLGHLPYKHEIIGQIRGLKEFFAVLFFVSIGLALIPIDFLSIMLPAGVMLALTVILLPVVTMIVLALFGYKRRTAFLTSISLAQLSEFGLIIARVGLDKGQLSPELFSLTIIVALISIALTSYIIKYDDQLYNMIGRRLKWFEKLSPHNKEKISFDSDDSFHEAILVGYDRTGYSIFQKLRKMKKKVIVVDMNPDIIRNLAMQKIPCMYGDIGDLEILEMLRIDKADLIISTVPNHHDTTLMIQKIREINPGATIIVTAYEAGQALELYKTGADYVIVPHFLGGEHLSTILQDLTKNLHESLKIKVNHMKLLDERARRHAHHQAKLS